MQIVVKALVIDDSAVMRKIVMKSLNEAQFGEFEFVEAGDGAEALEKVKETQFDIAFIDWNMPNMSGIEFVREVRTLERREDREKIPLVMVTSEKTMAKVQEALDEAGADQFISKPFTVEELQRKLKAPIERARTLNVRRNRPAKPAGAAQPAKQSGFLAKMFG
jgi:two-component system chemotaxis response regulator CheY